ncbi:hypothetical protein Tco_0558757 [Tanacetum coccineum]
MSKASEEFKKTGDIQISVSLPFQHDEEEEIYAYALLPILELSFPSKVNYSIFSSITSPISTSPPPLTTTLEPRELLFPTPPSSPHAYLDTLEDLPPRSINPPPLPTFESMERVARKLSLLPAHMDVETSLPPIPPHLPPPNTFLPIDQSLWIEGPPPQPTRHENLCDH